MAGAPALLLGVLGITGRTQVHTWQFSEYGPAVHQRLLAYTPYVQDRFGELIFEASDEDVIVRADEWIAAYRNGGLQDIPPGALDDQGSRGVKNEILQARLAVIAELNRRSRTALANGRHADAADLAWRALAVCDIGKYSGVNLIIGSTANQNAALATLKAAAPRLTKDQAREAAAQVSSVRHAKDSMSGLLHAMARLQVEQTMKELESLPSMRVASPYRGLATISFGEASGISVLEPGGQAAQGQSILLLELKGAVKAESRYRAGHAKAMAALLSRAGQEA